MKNKQKASTAQRLTNALNMPLSAVSNEPRFEIISNKEISVENYKSISEYDDNLIKLDFARLTVSFWGKDLNLRCITEDSVVINGTVSSIEFEIRGAYGND